MSKQDAVTHTYRNLRSTCVAVTCGQADSMTPGDRHMSIESLGVSDGRVLLACGLDVGERIGAPKAK